MLGNLYALIKPADRYELPAPVSSKVSKLAKIQKGVKPRIRYLCDTSKSFIYYTTRDEEEYAYVT